MAAKRVASSTINWAAIAERVPEQAKPKFLAFKSKSDNYLRRVVTLPEAPPKIDWAYYKANVALSGLVDNFQKSYEALSVPYPGDQGRLKEVDAQETEHKAKLSKFIDEQKALILKSKEELAVKEREIPHSELTYEEFLLVRPDDSYNPKYPTLWPHEEEERELTKQWIAEGKLKVEGDKVVIP